MKLAEKNVLPACIALLVAFNLYVLPLSSSLVSMGAAFIWYGFTQSLPAVLVILLIPGIVRIWNSMMEPQYGRPVRGASEKQEVATDAPAGAEGFQARDPVSIHQRLQTVKGTQPRVEGGPVGVLESANILDNAVLENFQDTPATGAPAASTFASALASVFSIGAPAEEAVPAAGSSPEKPLRTNHALEEDEDSVKTALVSTGTGLPDADQPAVMAGISAGSAGPAF